MAQAPMPPPKLTSNPGVCWRGGRALRAALLDADSGMACLAGCTLSKPCSHSPNRDVRSGMREGFHRQRRVISTGAGFGMTELAAVVEICGIAARLVKVHLVPGCLEQLCGRLKLVGMEIYELIGLGGFKAQMRLT